MNNVERLIQFMNTPIEIADYNDASGLILESVTARGYLQTIGPFDKNKADVFEAIDILRAAEDPEGPPDTYIVRPLFPPSFAQMPGLAR